MAEEVDRMSEICTPGIEGVDVLPEKSTESIVGEETKPPS